jgi:CRISPR/Cas system-associated protein Csm6
MAVPELILLLASTLAGAGAIFFIFPVAATVMFAVTAMVVFVLTR